MRRTDSGKKILIFVVVSLVNPLSKAFEKISFSNEKAMCTKLNNEMEIKKEKQKEKKGN